MLFTVRNADGSYRPADDRIVARLDRKSLEKHYGGKIERFERQFREEARREKERQKRQADQDFADRIAERAEYLNAKLHSVHMDGHAIPNDSGDS